MKDEARAVVIGDLVLDLVARTPGQLNYGTDTRGEIYPRPGGSAANTATWLARLGVPVLFAGRVGADPLGRALVRGLEQEGVEARVGEDPEAPTGVVLALTSPDGERSMLISPGANHPLARSDLPLDALPGAALLHLTGYSFVWDTTREAASFVMAAARDLGVPVAVDVSSTALVRRYGVDRFLAAVEGATYLFCGMRASSPGSCGDWIRPPRPAWRSGRRPGWWPGLAPYLPGGPPGTGPRPGRTPRPASDSRERRQRRQAMPAGLHVEPGLTEGRG